MPSIAASLLIIRDNAFLESLWSPVRECWELRFKELTVKFWGFEVRRGSVWSFVEQVVGGEETESDHQRLAWVEGFRCSIANSRQER